MNRNFVVVVIFTALAGFGGQVVAQTLARQTLGAAGGDFRGPEARLNFTLGESATGYFAAEDFSLAQGFQQGEARVSVSRSPETPPESGIKVWPNPARESAAFSAPEGRAYRAELYDYSGRKVLAARKSAGAPEGRISLSGLAAGVYLLRLTPEKGGPAQTYRLIKQ